MLHSIVAIVTTTSVMFHALPGCCKHDAQSYTSHEHGLENVEKEPLQRHAHCGHGHRAHRGDSLWHEHFGGSEHDWRPENSGPCHETDCSFVSADRCDEVMRVLSQSLCLSVISNTVSSTIVNCRADRHSNARRRTYSCCKGPMSIPS